MSPSSTGIRFRPSRMTLPTYRTSFVVVSRVTVSQRRQPRRWNHRSVLGPDGVRGQEDASEIRFHVGCVDRPELPAPRELGRGAPPAVRARHLQRHRRLRLRLAAAPSQTRRAMPRTPALRSRRRPGAPPPRTGRGPRSACGIETTPASGASRTAARCGDHRGRCCPRSARRCAPGPAGSPPAPTRSCREAWRRPLDPADDLRKQLVPAFVP